MCETEIGAFLARPRRKGAKVVLDRQQAHGVLLFSPTCLGAAERWTGSRLLQVKLTVLVRRLAVSRTTSETDLKRSAQDETDGVLIGRAYLGDDRAVGGVAHYPVISVIDLQAHRVGELIGCGD